MRRIFLGNGGRFVESFLGRLTLVVLFTVLSAVILSFTFLVNRMVSPMLLKFTIIPTIGLAAGVAARRFLPSHTGLLRFLVAALALLLAFGVLNLITLGFLGINMLRVYPNSPEWDGALQTGIGLIFAGLAVRAWRPLRGGLAVEPAAPSGRTAARQRSSRLSPISAGYWRERWSNRPRISSASIQAGLDAPRRWMEGWLPRSKVKVRSGNGRPRGLFSRRKKSDLVQLSSAVEHRCPYCLEIVDPHDARGVKICPVCKTRHHADCWAVTGVCQVPHEHS